MSVEATSAKAAVFFGPGKPFEIRDVPIPDVEPEGVLIRVTLANICGSDLHFWRGDAPLRYPDDGWNFGHEMTGRVARLGARVKTDSLGRPLTEGDRVAYTYFYPCRRCHACLNNQPAACPTRSSGRSGRAPFRTCTGPSPITTTSAPAAISSRCPTPCPTKPSPRSTARCPR